MSMGGGMGGAGGMAMNNEKMKDKKMRVTGKRSRGRYL
jgi:hypothetical protein